MESIIPEIGKEYDCFDDGKINDTRKYKVIIKEIIPFDKATDKLKEQWVEACQTHSNLADKTDYLIVSDSYEQLTFITEEIFARDTMGGWFGLGEWWNCGKLDVDGSLLKSYKDV